MKYTPQHCCSLVPGGHFDFFIVRKMPKVYHPAADVQKSFRINEKTYSILKEQGRCVSFPDYNVSQ